MQTKVFHIPIRTIVPCHPHASILWWSPGPNSHEMPVVMALKSLDSQQNFTENIQQDLGLMLCNLYLWLGLCLRPHWRSLQCFPGPPAGFLGLWGGQTEGREKKGEGKESNLGWTDTIFGVDRCQWCLSPMCLLYNSDACNCCSVFELYKYMFMFHLSKVRLCTVLNHKTDSFKVQHKCGSCTFSLWPN